MNKWMDMWPFKWINRPSTPFASMHGVSARVRLCFWEIVRITGYIHMRRDSQTEYLELEIFSLSWKARFNGKQKFFFYIPLLFFTVVLKRMFANTILYWEACEPHGNWRWNEARAHLANRKYRKWTYFSYWIFRLERNFSVVQRTSKITNP